MQIKTFIVFALSALSTLTSAASTSGPVTQQDLAKLTKQDYQVIAGAIAQAKVTYQHMKQHATANHKRDFWNELAEEAEKAACSAACAATEELELACDALCEGVVNSQ